MRRISVLALLGGLLLAALSAGRTWLVAASTDPVLGERSIDASGRDLSTAINGALVLAGAAGVVLVLSRGWPRRVAALVMCVDALWASWLSVSVVASPDSAAANVSRSTVAPAGGLGSPAAVVTEVDVSLWPWAFTAGAALVLVGGAGVLWTDLIAARGPTLAPMKPPDSAGHEVTPDLPETERRRRENARAWDDLSDGKDLTP
ncbi:MAG: Trp biosynthesis-associated membrane protein [Ornithinimicrobium sp.]